MERKVDTLKHFIDNHVQKGYINFKALKERIFELYTPRKKKGFNPAYEGIFEAYETYRGREYRGYKYRDNFKAAVRKSKTYKIIFNKEKKFIFQERTPQEIANFKKKLKTVSKNMVVMSPTTSGYETGENSPISRSSGYEAGENSLIPSPNTSKYNDCTVVDTPQHNYEIINFEDVHMEELTDENIKIDPVQELCYEVYEKFYPSDQQYYQDEFRQNIDSQNLDKANITFQSTDANSSPQGVSLEPQGKCTAFYQIAGNSEKFVTKPNTNSLNKCITFYVFHTCKK